VIWKELFEVFQRPLGAITLLAASVLIVWASGELAIEQPPLRVFLYRGGATAEDLAAARTALQEFARAEVTEVDETVVRPDAMRRSGASYAIARRGGEWAILHELPTSREEESIEIVASNIGRLLNGSRSELGDVGLSINGPSVSRMSSFPREPRLQLVPRTMALILAFLPFVLAVRSYAREVAFGTLPILLVAPTGGWGQLLVGKLVSIICMVVVIFLFLLIGVQSIFDLSPKLGLVTQLSVQALAIFTSACLGLTAAIVARNQFQVYLSVAIYFVVLLLLSGVFFSLESADLIIRAASYANPLSFSSKVLENWLLFGVGPVVDEPEVVYLLTQCACAAVLLVVCARLTAKRI
jgi:hypothetical protein